MNEHKELVIKALEDMRRDCVLARQSFSYFTPDDIQACHLKYGKTHAEILAEYETYDAKIDAAIAWVESQA